MTLQMSSTGGSTIISDNTILISLLSSYRISVISMHDLGIMHFFLSGRISGAEAAPSCLCLRKMLPPCPRIPWQESPKKHSENLRTAESVLPSGLFYATMTICHAKYDKSETITLQRRHDSGNRSTNSCPGFRTASGWMPYWKEEERRRKCHHQP